MYLRCNEIEISLVKPVVFNQIGIMESSENILSNDQIDNEVIQARGDILNDIIDYSKYEFTYLK